MASIIRQPFAPLDEARLQALSSIKNRQNAVSSLSPGKRKAYDVTESDDFENVDPILFSKRVKGGDSVTGKGSFREPPTFILTKSASTNDLPVSVATPAKASTPVRTILKPKSPAARLNTSIARSSRPSPVSAPAGRSPTRGKRSGIMSARRRTGGSFTRVDPPVFALPSTSSATLLSLDAALKGTIPMYNSRHSDVSASKRSSRPSDSSLLHEPEMKASWSFEIHEDTPEQEMTNLLQHSTCVLDISSDEESESRLQRERAEGKENVPPPDDVSQTSHARAPRVAANPDEMVIEKKRSPLGEMDPSAYYPEGCDANSVFIVPGDDDEEVPISAESQLAPQPSASSTVESSTVAEAEDEPGLASEEEVPQSIEELMGKTKETTPGAVVLDPVEDTEESFEVWESSSAKDEAEAAPHC
ncbi:hypothetical protein F5Y17DRAFT_214197 [Xylariaceae sp. FL0594]|nr:hypothetical protein F5Y17DRAFT_214197 [Xylariaceae sp. FL0594]